MSAKVLVRQVKEGLASAFVINEANGLLTLVNQQPTVVKTVMLPRIAGSHPDSQLRKRQCNRVSDWRMGDWATDLKQHLDPVRIPTGKRGPTRILSR